MLPSFVGILLLLLVQSVFAWNSLGHKLVAQIAYNHLSSKAKRLCNRYSHALDTVYAPQSFINAATWLDTLRQPEELWLKPMHYIGLPYSKDGSTMLPPHRLNAVYAIEHAKNILANKQANLFDKGFQLRILLHVVGDIHQPMHAVTQYSYTFPRGDRGGNLYHLKSNPVGANLHAYWDNGGGLFKTTQDESKKMIFQTASNIEQHWPCELQAAEQNPTIWAKESHQLAVKKAYRVAMEQKPSKAYQKMVNTLSEERIALAGCRLAALLNTIAA